VNSSGTTADSTPNQPSTGVSDPPPASNVVYDSGDREADERLEKQMQDDESFARSLQASKLRWGPPDRLPFLTIRSFGGIGRGEKKIFDEHVQSDWNGSSARSNNRRR